jgi:hypothetical protein
MKPQKPVRGLPLAVAWMFLSTGLVLALALPVSAPAGDRLNDLADRTNSQASTSNQDPPRRGDERRG